MAALLEDHVLEYELVTKKQNVTAPVYPGPGRTGSTCGRDGACIPDSDEADRTAGAEDHLYAGAAQCDRPVPAGL